MILKFKNKLREFLDIKDTSELENKIKKLELENSKLKKDYSLLKDKVSTIDEVIYKGADLHMHKYDKDWAVVCIKGRETDYIKLYTFNGKGQPTYQYVTEFFETLGHNRRDMYDIPPFLKYFIDEKKRY